MRKVWRMDGMPRALREIDRRRVSIAALLAVVLAACTVGPDYRPPEHPSPAAYDDTAGQGDDTHIPRDWWKAFGDPQLDALIEQTLAANADLGIALARHDEARAALGVARADEFPLIDTAPSATRARTSATTANPLPRKLATTYGVPFDLAYEVDLWGRVRRSVASAAAQLDASADTLDALRLSLAADTTTSYLQLRAYDREAVVLEDTLRLREDQLKLTENRARVGVTTDLDAIRARGDLAGAHADLDDIQRRRALTLHALAVLGGRDAPGFALAADARGQEIPNVPAGLPATLLRRRPDVAAAERQLAASSEQIGVAKAAFFPTLRLTALGGAQSKDLDLLLENPSIVWSIGPSLSLPLFDGGRRRRNLELTEARYREQEASYRKTTLVAFREVQDALSDASFLAARTGYLDAQVDAAQAAAKLSRSRYERGVAGYLDVLDADRTALLARRAAVQNEQLRLAAAVSLFKALGGGWAPSDTDSVPTRPGTQ